VLVVQVAAADELTTSVVGTLTQPLVAAITRRIAQISVNWWRATAMSVTTAARTAASRPWRPRGVPTPRIERITDRGKPFGAASPTGNAVASLNFN